MPKIDFAFRGAIKFCVASACDLDSVMVSYSVYNCLVVSQAGGVGQEEVKDVVDTGWGCH